MEPAVQGWVPDLGRRVESALLAKVGTFVFVAVVGSTAGLSPASARTAIDAEDPAVPVVASSDAHLEARRGVRPNALTTFIELPETRPPRAHRAARAATLGEASGPTRSATVPDGYVLASWYGPGLYGGRTACGLAYTPEILGVAHRTLPCGTPVTITSPSGHTLTVPVIDRGPFVAGRALDLSYATKVALACTDLCAVLMSVPQ